MLIEFEFEFEFQLALPWHYQGLVSVTIITMFIVIAIIIIIFIIFTIISSSSTTDRRGARLPDGLPSNPKIQIETGVESGFSARHLRADAWAMILRYCGDIAHRANNNNNAADNVDNKTKRAPVIQTVAIERMFPPNRSGQCFDFACVFSLRSPQSGSTQNSHSNRLKNQTERKPERALCLLPVIRAARNQSPDERLLECVHSSANECALKPF